MISLKRIGIGTAQWGMPYGIANQSGMPGLIAIRKMLTLANYKGCELIDTAYVYGRSEAMLGEHYDVANHFKIVTKTLPLNGQPVTVQTVAEICSSFESSLLRLRRDQVYSLLVHHSEDLLSKNGEILWYALERLRKLGHIVKLGVSVYQPESLLQIIARFPVELVQIPINIFDQRFLRSGLLKYIKEKDIEIHARSIFLQGLLLLPIENFTGHFSGLQSHQASLQSWLKLIGMTPYQACVKFCLDQQEIDRMIVGCETIEQMEELFDSLDDINSLPAHKMERFSVDNDELINPSRWPKYIRTKNKI